MIRKFYATPLIIFLASLLIACDSVSPKTTTSQTNISQDSSSQNNDLPIEKGSANYVTFDSAESLASRADVIIIGQTKSDFQSSQAVSIDKENKGKAKIKVGQSVVVRDEMGQISDYYTITPVTIKKVLKGTDTVLEKEISVIQAGAVVEEPGRDKYILADDGFSPLVKNAKYLLFLSKVDSTIYPNLEDTYSIISVNQGKFNLDKTDKKEAKVETDDEQYKNLKQKVMKKYDRQLDLVP